MILSWRLNLYSYSEMIKKKLNYFNEVIDSKDRGFYYVGNTWGDRNKDYVTDGDGPYVNLAVMTNSEKVTLAVSLIKKEMDYLDYTIMKYIECIHEFELISDDFYNKIKYGSDDSQIIDYIKAGVSHSLAKLLKDKYEQFVNSQNKTFSLNSDIISEMQSNTENLILISEAENFVIN